MTIIARDTRIVFLIVHGNVVSELMLQLSQLKGDKCVSLLGVMQ